MGDSGAVFTTETTKNSELKNAIFTIFALKLVELSSIKALANNCENKASLWINKSPAGLCAALPLWIY